MDVLITQKKMTDSEAFVKARGGGNLIGKAMYGGGKITMKQLYLQSFEVVFDAYFKPGLVERFFTRKGQMGGNSQKICMIVEGTRCNGNKHVRAKTGAVRMAVENSRLEARSTLLTERLREKLRQLRPGAQ